MHLRFVKRDTAGGKSVRVLQQWWVGGGGVSLDNIAYTPWADPSKGKWRDVPMIDQPEVPTDG